MCGVQMPWQTKEKPETGSGMVCVCVCTLNKSKQLRCIRSSQFALLCSRKTDPYRILTWSEDKSDNKGLISADRNNKATLLLTIPRCTFKSYAKDLSPRMVTLPSAGKTRRLSATRPVPACCGAAAEALFVSVSDVRGENRRVLAWILT